MWAKLWPTRLETGRSLSPSMSLSRGPGRLLKLLHRLVDEGRTLILIEHGLDVIAAADHVIDIGPDARHNGGLVQFAGNVTDLIATDTHTGKYLRRHLGTRDFCTDGWWQCHSPTRPQSSG